MVTAILAGLATGALLNEALRRDIDLTREDRCVYLHRGDRCKFRQAHNGPHYVDGAWDSGK